MTLLAELVATSQRVGSASARGAKVRELATFLKSVPSAEIETAVHYLSGQIAQGRIGVAYKALKEAAASPAAGEAACCRSRKSTGLSPPSPRFAAPAPRAGAPRRCGRCFRRRRRGAGIPAPARRRRASARRTRGRHARGDRRGRRCAGGDRAPRGDVLEELGSGGARALAGRSGALAKIPARAVRARLPHARANRRRPGGSFANPGRRSGVRVEDGRRAHSGAQGVR
jgi:hypothetical protein